MSLPRPLLFIVLGILVLLLFLADLFVGTVNLPPSVIFDLLTSQHVENKEWELIFWEIRLPKAITALLCGAGLSLGGLLTQTLFRNPLTGPDVLGLTSGAGLGVAFSILAGFSSNISISLMASLGAAASFLVISLAAGRVSSNTLLILGLMFGAFSSAAISVLQFFSESTQLQQYTIWTLGTISTATGQQLDLLMIVIPLSLMIGFSAVKSLNAGVLGDGYMKSMGLSPKVLRWKVLLTTSLLTGTITAICGPITFIGIAGPHLVKQGLRITDHRMLLPISALSGSALVLLCDLITQIPGGGSILPLNAVTALFGAPVVIWIILKSKIGS